MTDCDLLMVNTIGPGFTSETVRQGGIGGSELEMTQVAEAMAARGHRVYVANGVAEESFSHGVVYMPFAQCAGMTARSLYIQRGTTLASIREAIQADHIAVRATDIMCEHYETHRPKFEAGIPVIGVSEWQLDGFRRQVPGIKTICIPPMLGPIPATAKVPGRFIYASAPCKGLDATLRMWRELASRWPKEMKPLHLIVALPGYAMGEAPPLNAYDRDAGIEYVGIPTVEEHRRLIASAEGLFFVNDMAETFCCVAAFAERSGTRAHILCKDGFGALMTTLVGPTLVTDDPVRFRDQFIANIGAKSMLGLVPPDLSPEALAPRWEEALGLGKQAAQEAPTRCDLPMKALSPEAVRWPSREWLNPEPLPYFGEFLSLLRREVQPGGSELGLGMCLFSLAASIRAACVVEIGRFRGFSTLALAGAMKWNALGWKEPPEAAQRPDVNYDAFHAPKKHRVVSIDKFPDPAAPALIEEAGLTEHVVYVDQDSQDVVLKGTSIDLLFIDGDHTYDGCKRDVMRFVPQVRAGGYIVLHDYFGWYEGTRNGSPIKRVCDELKAQGIEQLLVDTGYASLVVLRKTALADVKAPTPVPPRADGKPTVGLVVLAKNENPIVARALMSCRDWLDATTVIVDAESTDGTADLCAKLGAEVHVRPYAGSLAETRNEALALAEQRTDYMLIVDADDLIEGTRPPELTADIYDLTIDDHGISYPRGQLIKSRIGARYVGCDRGCKMNIPHEYLDRPGAKHGGNATTLVYKRLGGVSGVSGFQDQAGPKAKYLRHARDLERHFVEHPDHARTVFYLGQSYRDAGEPRQAREWYRKRAAMQPLDEEAWFSLLRAAELTQELGEDPVEAYLQAYEACRARAEPLLGLAVWYRDEKRKRFELAYLYAKQAASLPIPEARLFVAAGLYQWGAKWEHGLAAHFTGRHAEAADVFTKVVAMCPPELQGQARDVLHKCVAARGA
jgi:hypothetical protein